ncbi:hypothetical protein AAZX31_07G083300 [Glycine max]|nr:hypothetical protein JHK87_017864 [Glycine soja]KAG5022044.1 hypothetical protein JHK85_018386 [Glycine max]KAG5142226.1 hypothetical protein JHK82_017921 [Glycine max]KAH1086004.1 hypothetical protein GYH30_017810 [Glycine max]
MDIRNCCLSCKRTIMKSGSCCCNEIEHANCKSSKMRWKVLWMKLKKEKKKLFESASSPLQVPYDPYTYSQNFDQGTAKDEPDNFSRSFSVRFADPSTSRVLMKKRVV